MRQPRTSCSPAIYHFRSSGARGRLPVFAKDIADTHDLVQDALFQVFRNLREFEYRGEGALHAYLRQAVINRIRGEKASGTAADVEPSIVVSGLDDADFAVSRDGRRLAYTRSHRQSTIWMAERPDDARSPIVRQQLVHATFEHRTPSISPDGQWLTFAAGQGMRKSNIHRMPLAGGAPQQLTFMEGHCVNPAWSPDGKQIAYLCDESGRYQVWIVGADGGRPRLLPKTEAILGTGSELAWSPGTRVLYRGPNGQVIAVDPETEDQRPLVRDPGFFVGGRAIYSPDGARVAVRGTTGLWVVATTDGSGGIVARDLALALVGWSPDGSSLLAHSADQMFAMPVAGGPSRVLFELPVARTTYVASRDAQRFVYVTTSRASDVWMVTLTRNRE
jgi:dipeptidyl aminopeptidase/acylaminoacyl peptidase